MNKTNTIKTYSELLRFRSFEDRFKYLMLHGSVGIETFGCSRFINQDFYRGRLWRDFRHHIIVRDNGFDLACRDHPLADDEIIVIHHINPLTLEQLMDDFDRAIDEENVISTSTQTHQAIHYGNVDYLQATTFVERKPFDTSPWRIKH